MPIKITKDRIKMKTTAVRLHGAMDIRLETFELPEINDNEILLRIMTDSLCQSTYKAVKQGTSHKRVPEDIADNPVIIGHEMCGEIVKVGKKLGDKWETGKKAIIQPALKLENGHDPGYSYKYVGGAATYVVVPEIVFERGCFLPFESDCWYKGSLVEAIGCVPRGFKGLYHTDYENYVRTDGAKAGGKLAILGGAGPMGIAAAALAAAYAHSSFIAVIDINTERLEHAARRYSPDKAAESGAKLIYVNTADTENPAKLLRDLFGGGFDDVFVMVPVSELFTLAGEITAEDGCINFFAGPADHALSGAVNLYHIHYDGLHIVGTAGSIPADTVETIKLIENGVIDPSIMVSHILGLDSYRETTLAMEKPTGAKKLCYNHISLPLTSLDDFSKLGETDKRFAELDRIVKENGGLWCKAAEEYLLKNNIS